MEVTEADLARVPMGNIRVTTAEFGAVWAAAERQVTAEADRGVTDWFAGGIVVTCRWLAGTVVTDQTGRRELPYSPATDRCVRAYEELIEAEYVVAEGLYLTRPDLVEHRPGWCDGIRSTLRWAWRHTASAPLVITRTSAG